MIPTMTNYFDLQLKLDGSSEAEEYLVKTDMDKEELIKKCEEIMEREERNNPDEMIMFHEHRDTIAEELEVEFIQPEKIRATCINMEIED